MRDINFFDAYLETKYVKFSKKLVLPLLTVFIFAFLLGYGIFKEFQIKDLKLDNDVLRILAEDPKTADKIEEVKAMEDEVRAFNLERNRVKDLDEHINKIDIVKEDFHKIIFSKQPDNIYLTSYNLSSGGMSLSGISKGKLSVAAFRKALEELDEIEHVYIGNLSGQDGEFVFDISAKLKGVDLDD